MIDALTDRANEQFDGILMSGGGNDIAGDSLCIWLNDAESCDHNYSMALNVNRFNGMLDMIAAAYFDLIAIRDELLPNAPIFVHTYDYPVVNGRGVCTMGPWLKPAFDFCGWIDEAECGKVLANMMRLFSGKLDSIARVTKNFTHVNTLGTLTADQWANELHPTPDGFKLIAAKFAAAIDAQFQ
jgi:hypothetical protein